VPGRLQYARAAAWLTYAIRKAGEAHREGVPPIYSAAPLAQQRPASTSSVGSPCVLVERYSGVVFDARRRF
jgi:hypothetical protein